VHFSKKLDLLLQLGVAAINLRELCAAPVIGHDANFLFRNDN
jgi:hypothetical protein